MSADRFCQIQLADFFDTFVLFAGQLFRVLLTVLVVKAFFKKPLNLSVGSASGRQPADQMNVGTSPVGRSLHNFFYCMHMPLLPISLL